MYKQSTHIIRRIMRYDYSLLLRHQQQSDIVTRITMSILPDIEREAVEIHHWDNTSVVVDTMHLLSGLDWTTIRVAMEGSSAELWPADWWRERVRGTVLAQRSTRAFPGREAHVSRYFLPDLVFGPLSWCWELHQRYASTNRFTFIDPMNPT